MRQSTDQGQTFGDAVTVAGLKTHGGNGNLGLTDSTGRGFYTNAFPQAAVNPVTGDIYVVYDDQANGSADKADIFFTESSDGGNKWSKPVRVNDDTTTNDQWQPALAVTPDGSHVGIFWYDRRVDPADNLIDRFGAIGTVSGHSVSFAPNFRITDVSFPPAFAQDPFFLPVAPGYMADYDMATADNNYFYTTWGDNRLPDNFFANQPDVRFAKIPVGGLNSATDPLSPSSVAGAPAGSTATAALPLPSAGPAHLARGGDLLPGASLALAAGLTLPVPGQAVPLALPAPAPAEGAVPPLAPQAFDSLFATAGQEDAWALVAATLGARHGTGDDWWADALAPAGQSGDGETAFWPAG
jgi:hypothetical protein